jgi:hypothetical protein
MTLTLCTSTRQPINHFIYAQELSQTLNNPITPINSFTISIFTVLLVFLTRNPSVKPLKNLHNASIVARNNNGSKCEFEMDAHSIQFNKYMLGSLLGIFQDQYRLKKKKNLTTNVAF